MQKSLTGIIADRYRQQSFDILTSKDDLKPADIRMICLDVGVALIVSVLLQKIIFIAMVFLLRGFVNAGLETGSTMFTVLNYTFSNISTYIPKLLAFGVLYKKYRPLKRLDTQYELYITAAVRCGRDTECDGSNSSVEFFRGRGNAYLYGVCCADI